jgi:hypothetical protein
VAGPLPRRMPQKPGMSVPFPKGAITKMNAVSFVRALTAITWAARTAVRHVLIVRTPSPALGLPMEAQVARLPWVLSPLFHTWNHSRYFFALRSVFTFDTP